LIWLTLVRIGTVISVGSAILHLIEQRTREINGSRIYSSEEAARFLGVDRRTVVKLIKNEEMSGKLVRGNYRILGQSIVEYLYK
jgi:excisionase family DNA binding protein